MTTTNDRGWRDDALFVGIACAIAWVLELLPVPPGARNAMVTAATFAPTLAALFVAARQGGRSGAVAMAKRWVSWRGSILAYLLAWFVQPAMLCFIAYVSGFQTTASNDTVATSIVYAAPLNYTFAVLFFGTAGPQGEELGWRGYLLPRWRARFGEAAAPGLVGVVWALWHLPLFFDPAWASPGIPLLENLATYGATVIGLSYALASVCWIGRDAIIPCILMHGAINVSYYMLFSYDGAMSHDERAKTFVLLASAWSTAAVCKLVWAIVKKSRAHETASSASSLSSSKIA